jgi:DnaK suppressor protein
VESEWLALRGLRRRLAPSLDGISAAGGAQDRLQGVRGVLTAKRADLLGRMAGISAAPTDQGGISFGKRVGDGTSIAVERLTQVAAHEQMLEQLAEVDRALEKLEESSYGLCDGCGSPIPEGRLEVHPSATRCVTCATR